MIPAKTTATESSFRTDTATFAIFDAMRLKHRLHDDADWWSIPGEEIAEINAGNVLFVSTGIDGDYLVKVYRKSPPENVLPIAISAMIRCDSGSLFFHAGEYVPSGNMMPDIKYGGLNLDFEPGTYRVTVVHLIEFCLEVYVVLSDDDPANNFNHSPTVHWPGKTNNQVMDPSPQTSGTL